MIRLYVDPVTCEMSLRADGEVYRVATGEVCFVLADGADEELAQVVAQLRSLRARPSTPSSPATPPPS